MKSTWHGLELEYSVGGLDSGPGLRADFCIEEVGLLRVQDEAEFRANHPTGTPNEVFEKHWQEIDDFLYREVADNDDGPDCEPYSD